MIETVTELSLPPFVLRHTGNYALCDSVALAARAAFVPDIRSRGTGEPGVLDLAFSLEGTWRPIGARIEQRNGRVIVVEIDNPDGAALDDIRAQLERILCLDIDGVAFDQIVARDDVVDALRQRRPGLRPVLFPSPFEAAARAIIGQQLPVQQAAAIHARIAVEHGLALTLGDAIHHAFPAPSLLANLPPVRGLAERKVEHLRALGRAAASGSLDTKRLRMMAPDEAISDLQRLPGIGPFSAELILLRGAGDPDAFPRQEKRLHNAMALAYRLGVDPTLETLAGIADGWRPYRSWVGLLLRNADWLSSR